MPQFDINLTRDVENWGKIRQVAQERKEISFHVANLELREAPNEADRIGLKKKKKAWGMFQIKTGLGVCL